MATSKPGTIDEYISFFPKETEKALQQVKMTIKTSAPGVKETVVMQYLPLDLMETM